MALYRRARRNHKVMRALGVRPRPRRKIPISALPAYIQKQLPSLPRGDCFITTAPDVGEFCGGITWEWDGVPYYICCSDPWSGGGGSAPETPTTIGSGRYPEP